VVGTVYGEYSVWWVQCMVSTADVVYGKYGEYSVVWCTLYTCVIRPNVRRSLPFEQDFHLRLNAYNEADLR
jgi:hypothetical protein